MTITNFNYEGSHLLGVICNIVVKADLGRWTLPGIEQRCLEYSTPNLAHEPTLANGPPSESRIDALNTATPNLADEPSLANGPAMNQEDVLNTTTPNLADEQHCTVMSDVTPRHPQMTITNFN